MSVLLVSLPLHEAINGKQYTMCLTKSVFVPVERLPLRRFQKPFPRFSACGQSSQTFEREVAIEFGSAMTAIIHCKEGKYKERLAWNLVSTFYININNRRPGLRSINASPGIKLFLSDRLPGISILQQKIT